MMIDDRGAGRQVLVDELVLLYFYVLYSHQTHSPHPIHTHLGHPTNR